MTLEQSETTAAGRTIAIGDIHSHADALRRLIDEIQPQVEDTIIPLGDYVNRGPDACGVIQTLIELGEHCRVFSILGNHDEMMLESRHNEHSLDRFRYEGGDQTLASYDYDAWFHGSNLSYVPDEHWDFLNRCLPFFETEHHIFTHACYDPFIAMNQQPSRLLRWTSIDDEPPAPHMSGKLVIIGHSARQSVRHWGHVMCIDTACGFEGRLTAHEPATGMTWWVNESDSKSK
ncbi:diadenosine tetraphosphatase [Rubripirellula obstinata]|uniref:Diadenosine tetraphosphatase n=1 Tax=Rubripirellula obstinata TaxID=406547 RepID=A0A5B1CCU6_9BACT|nr:metallophosphoesterase [Rubripirellula obstinata]KAA1258386.1 diadenosine tetraphosphatase [Rubripirellula obstinata]